MPAYCKPVKRCMNYWSPKATCHKYHEHSLVSSPTPGRNLLTHPFKYKRLFTMFQSTSIL